MNGDFARSIVDILGDFLFVCLFVCLFVATVYGRGSGVDSTMNAQTMR